jgi:hypothetical protein
MAGIVPDGMLVFFPSYQAMDEAVQFWKKTVGEEFGFFGQFLIQLTKTYQGIWSLLERHKQIVLEPREKSAFTKVRFPKSLSIFFWGGGSCVSDEILGTRGLLQID